MAVNQSLNAAGEFSMAGDSIGALVSQRRGDVRLAGIRSGSGRDALGLPGVTIAAKSPGLPVSWVGAAVELAAPATAGNSVKAEAGDRGDSDNGSGGGKTRSPRTGRG